jgi:nudix-type nucleoside diphosphatase (YffH/AdpP family)
MPFQITNIDTAFTGRRSKLLVLNVELPDGQTMRREIEDHGPAVAVLPYDPDRRTAILVRQFRAPVFLVSGDEALVEAIAGIVESDDPAACGRREASEEAGLELKALDHVGSVWTMPGVSTERMHLYLATYSEADRVGKGGGLADEHENTDVVEIALAELAGAVDAGRLDDMKTALLVQTLRLRRPELFA